MTNPFKDGLGYSRVGTQLFDYTQQRLESVFNTIAMSYGADGCDPQLILSLMRDAALDFIDSRAVTLRLEAKRAPTTTIADFWDPYD